MSFCGRLRVRYQSDIKGWLRRLFGNALYEQPQANPSVGENLVGNHGARPPEVESVVLDPQNRPGYLRNLVVGDPYYVDLAFLGTDPLAVPTHTYRAAFFVDGHPSDTHPM